jgi:DNA helicase-2/ATP-dependent DNA helicase PcrA
MFKPSNFQTAIIEAVKTTRTHIVIDAKAGSGKTSTLKLIVNELGDDERICLLAFNRTIATELTEKIPARSNLQISTCHSAGMKILKTGKNAIKVDDKNQKIRDLLTTMCAQWGWDLSQEDYRDMRQTVSTLIDLARMDMASTVHEVRALAQKHNLDIWEDEDAKVIQCLDILKRHRSTIDFTDMIWLSAIGTESEYRYPRYTTILVDECQDLSKAQQTMILKMLAPGGRIIAVGDPQQAIYGFAGADSESFTMLKSLPNAQILPLNECYRCGKKIIEAAKRFCPGIEAFAGNCDGEVGSKSVNDIQDGDFVLCRNTMPLVKLCYKLIGEGKAAFVKGRDIGANLINLVKKAKGDTLEAVQATCDKELAAHYRKLCRLNPQLSEGEIQSLSSWVTQEEKVKIIKLIIANNGTVVDKWSLIEKINKIFQEGQKGGICLSTIHKAKGLEADNVFIVDAYLMPSKFAKLEWQKEQEKNLQYVAYTRAKKLLAFVSDWTAQDEKDNEPYMKEI